MNEPQRSEKMRHYLTPAQQYRVSRWIEEHARELVDQRPGWESLAARLRSELKIEKMTASSVQTAADAAGITWDPLPVRNHTTAPRSVLDRLDDLAARLTALERRPAGLFDPAADAAGLRDSLADLERRVGQCEPGVREALEAVQWLANVVDEDLRRLCEDVRIACEAVAQLERAARGPGQETA